VSTVWDRDVAEAHWRRILALPTNAGEFATYCFAGISSPNEDDHVSSQYTVRRELRGNPDAQIVNSSSSYGVGYADVETVSCGPSPKPPSTFEDQCSADDVLLAAVAGVPTARTTTGTDQAAARRIERRSIPERESSAMWDLKRSTSSSADQRMAPIISFEAG
jgi:hypothetical protein